MSITAETAKQHANDPAVLCCRAEAGITIEPANLEDPAIFDELVDSGLLNLDGCLKIGQVLGAKLTKTSDSLSPLTADNMEGYKDSVEEEAALVEEAAAPVEEAAAPVAKTAPVATTAKVAGGVLKIHIGEGKDIDLSIPVGALGEGGSEVVELLRQQRQQQRHFQLQLLQQTLATEGKVGAKPHKKTFCNHRS